MHKSYQLLLFFILFSAAVSAQVSKDTLSPKDKAILDSMLANDEFLNMLDEKDKAYTDVFVAIGNGVFSEHNQAANATGVTNQLVFTPGVTYHFKGGFGIGATGFFTKQDSESGINLYQTGLTASYDYAGKAVKAGIAYTRYLSDKNKYNSKSVYQNDFFGYIKKAAGIVKPGLSFGYANGNYKEVSFVSFAKIIHLNFPPPNGRDTTIIISGKDSTDNKTSYFSVTASIEHDFIFYGLFSKDDELDIIPALLVNAGSDKNTQTHTNRIFDRSRRLNKVKKVESNNKFQLQSLAFSLDVTYAIGKFFIQPNIYLDYYLPSTTSKRLSSIYSITTGFSF